MGEVTKLREPLQDLLELRRPLCQESCLTTEFGFVCGKESESLASCSKRLQTLKALRQRTVVKHLFERKVDQVVCVNFDLLYQTCQSRVE